MKCYLHGGNPPQHALDSTALCTEGSDYVRHFCGEGCLANWCEKTQPPRSK